MSLTSPRIAHTTSTAQVAFEAGQEVMFKEDFICDSKIKKALQKGKCAKIKNIDEDGDVQLDLGEGRICWVFKKNFDKLVVTKLTPADVTPSARGGEAFLCEFGLGCLAETFHTRGRGRAVPLFGAARPAVCSDLGSSKQIYMAVHGSSLGLRIDVSTYESVEGMSGCSRFARRTEYYTTIFS